MRHARVEVTRIISVIPNCYSCKHGVDVPNRKLPLCRVGPEYQLDCIHDSFEHWHPKEGQVVEYVEAAE